MVKGQGHDFEKEGASRGEGLNGGAPAEHPMDAPPAEPTPSAKESGQQ